MSITHLVQVVSPPENPLETGAFESWDDVEQAIGIQLPEDYKKLIGLYGSGRFNGDILVYNPFSIHASLNLLQGGFDVLGWYRDQHRDFPQYAPLPAFPAPAGLLIWGSDGSGNEFYWQTTGPPEAWPVVLINDGNTIDEVFELHVTEFLARYFAGDLESRVIGPDLLERGRFFEPAADG